MYFSIVGAGSPNDEGMRVVSPVTSSDNRLVCRMLKQDQTLFRGANAKEQSVRYEAFFAAELSPRPNPVKYPEKSSYP